MTLWFQIVITLDNLFKIQQQSQAFGFSIMYMHFKHRPLITVFMYAPSLEAVSTLRTKIIPLLWSVN